MSQQPKICVDLTKREKNKEKILVKEREEKISKSFVSAKRKCDRLFNEAEKFPLEQKLWLPQD